jgi:hypothetical protein
MCPSTLSCAVLLDHLHELPSLVRGDFPVFILKVKTYRLPGTRIGVMAPFGGPASEAEPFRNPTSVLEPNVAGIVKDGLNQLLTPSHNDTTRNTSSI